MKRLYSIGFILFAALAVIILFQGSGPNKSLKDTIYLDVYMNIFEPSCAISACHDGSFEPNFTTAQSSYYTMVLHGLVKNSPNGNFEYRVVPGDTSNSLLYERITNCCFVDDLDRMPLLNMELTREEKSKIGQWIILGAPDWKGEFPYKSEK